MQFSHSKLPPAAANTLRNCPISTVAPFALMISPVYVFLRRNQKFVAVKAPLDFFSPNELDQLRPFQSFFLPPCVDSALFFRESARRIRAMIQWVPNQKTAGMDAISKDVCLPPTPYEISDTILRILGPLWGKERKIEPFYVAVFTNEICELLPPELLKGARDKNVAHFEAALFRSSWAVFLALHTGYFDPGFLNRLRRQAFDEANTDETLITLASAIMGGTENINAILQEDFLNRPERLAQKLTSRFERMNTEFPIPDKHSPSILGSEGFIDV